MIFIGTSLVYWMGDGDCARLDRVPLDCWALVSIEFIQRDVIETGFDVEVQKTVISVLQDFTGVLEALVTQYRLKLLDSTSIHYSWLLLRLSLWEKFFHINDLFGKMFMVTTFHLG